MNKKYDQVWYFIFLFFEKDANFFKIFSDTVSMAWLMVMGIAFILFVVAELGDKTQLMTISLACRYKPIPVFGGVFCGMALVTGLGVFVGTLLYSYIPFFLLKIFAATIFIIFGVYALFSNEKEAKTDIKDSHVFRNSFFLSFIAEMGDKTQFAVIGLTVSYALPLPVLLGSLAGLALVIGIGVFFGKKISQHVERNKLKKITAVLFIIIGIIFFAEILI